MPEEQFSPTQRIRQVLNQHAALFQPLENEAGAENYQTVLRQVRQAILRREIYLKGTNPITGSPFLHSLTNFFYALSRPDGSVWLSYHDAYIGETQHIQISWIEEIWVGGGPGTVLQRVSIGPEPLLSLLRLNTREDRQTAHVNYWCRYWGSTLEPAPIPQHWR